MDDAWSETEERNRELPITPTEKCIENRKRRDANKFCIKIQRIKNRIKQRKTDYIGECHHDDEEPK